MTIPGTLRFSRWEAATLLRVTGEDAATFLQGQFTNELRGKADGEAVYGLWLNQKGKVVSDSFIVRSDGPEGKGFFVVSYFCSASTLRQRLEDYVIADDVNLEDRAADWAGVCLIGEGAKAWLASEARPGMIFPGRRAAIENVEWIFPRSAWGEVEVKLAGIFEISGRELTRLRIAAGIPAVPADIGPGDLPGEAGLEAEAISYTKGCYLGQEVMARLKAMGRVRRRLFRVESTGEMPDVPAALWQGAQQVGELRSAVATENGFIGLAMLSLVTLKPELALTLPGEDPAGILLLPLTP